MGRGSIVTDSSLIFITQCKENATWVWGYNTWRQKRTRGNKRALAIKERVVRGGWVGGHFVLEDAWPSGYCIESSGYIPYCNRQKTRLIGQVLQGSQFQLQSHYQAMVKVYTPRRYTEGSLFHQESLLSWLWRQTQERIWSTINDYAH